MTIHSIWLEIVAKEMFELKNSVEFSEVTLDEGDSTGAEFCLKPKKTF